MRKAYVFSVIGILVVLLVIIALSNGKATSFETLGQLNEEMTLYKSSTCGCCGIYSNYFMGQGNDALMVKNLDETSLSSFKREQGIPEEMESCHTTIVGDYFVEGHIPLEAVEKLLLEKPNIKGIAMPGMPSGSPGMPGGKYGDFVIYAINHDGSYEEFMRL